MSSIAVQVANIFRGHGQLSNGIYIAIALCSTTYCLYWDYYMDWGLFRSKSKGKKYLRSKLMYPVPFYYYAMVSNFFLRFFWILSLIPETSLYEWEKEAEMIIIIQTFAEAFRRAQWSLIRVENENINNFEKYRTILMIPTLKEDNEEID